MYSEKQVAVFARNRGYQLAEEWPDAPLYFLVEFLSKGMVGDDPLQWLEKLLGPDFGATVADFSILSKKDGIIYLKNQGFIAYDSIENPSLAEDSFVTSPEDLVSIMIRWYEKTLNPKFNKITITYKSGKVLFFCKKVNNPNLLISPYTDYWNNDPRQILLKKKEGCFKFGSSSLDLPEPVASQDTRLAFFLANDVKDKAQQWIDYIKKPIEFYSKTKDTRYVRYHQDEDRIIIGYKPLAKLKMYDPFSFETYSKELIRILKQWDQLYKDLNVNKILMEYRDGNITLMSDDS